MSKKKSIDSKKSVTVKKKIIKKIVKKIIKKKAPSKEEQVVENTVKFADHIPVKKVTFEEKAGCRHTGDYSNIAPANFAGVDGHHSPYSYSLKDKERAMRALAESHFAPDPGGIQRAIYKRFPELDPKCKKGKQDASKRNEEAKDKEDNDGIRVGRSQHRQERQEGEIAQAGISDSTKRSGSLQEEKEISKESCKKGKEEEGKKKKVIGSHDEVPISLFNEALHICEKKKVDKTD